MSVHALYELNMQANLIFLGSFYRAYVLGFTQQKCPLVRKIILLPQLIFKLLLCCFGPNNHSYPSVYFPLYLLQCFSHCSCFPAATFDRTGHYVITGSDDRLVKIWAIETAFCLASCRGHEVSFSYCNETYKYSQPFIQLPSIFQI
jgi:WD40 repeat protein